MGKLIATTQATIDGVIDPVGEWVQPDGDHGVYSFERQARSSGLVLGRKTYEGLAGFWPSQTGKWADMVNSMPKYVGSRTLSGDLEWNATLLKGDLEDSIPKLKNQVNGDLFMHGSGGFAYALAEKPPNGVRATSRRRGLESGAARRAPAAAELSWSRSKRGAGRA